MSAGDGKSRNSQKDHSKRRSDLAGWFIHKTFTQATRYGVRCEANDQYLLCETTSPLYWKHLIHRTSFNYLPKYIPPVHDRFLTEVALEYMIPHILWSQTKVMWRRPSRYPLMHSGWQEAKTAFLENSMHSFINASCQWVSRKCQAAFGVGGFSVFFFFPLATAPYFIYLFLHFSSFLKIIVYSCNQNYSAPTAF